MGLPKWRRVVVFEGLLYYLIKETLNRTEEIRHLQLISRKGHPSVRDFNHPFVHVETSRNMP
ncbi:hypothetical protein DPMN_105481 [Dreissena polymorpha]|uniref:Uncharacterized protein n=1 Tax=Dreissena polymorpha TaxID=45954 RepID=A0A9D4HGU9_DREPO|nr:hypothetical protein DPMN_105481 [Dreissena polymorpha]